MAMINGWMRAAGLAGTMEFCGFTEWLLHYGGGGLSNVTDMLWASTTSSSFAASLVDGSAPGLSLLLVGVVTCLLMSAVAVALWRWKQRGAAVGAAGLTILQSVVLVRPFLIE
ncbi:hypothetical protein [Deinococcus sp. 6GRE01]|uniref:hypothetical protein n=1 Tax=Deinococcus sp. 6GRE01 TaxID=2745873 RepID=UPI001E479455|nr:hypothetical protein [Deinococcus sp. 6GRE01]